VIDRNTPSDPRLQERRGDLVGRSALLFAFVVLIAVGAAGAYILSSRPPAESAGVSASPHGSASPSPVASSPVASSTPTRRPSASPRPSPSEPPAAPTLAVGTPAELLVEGDVVGTVTASAPRYRGRLAGQRAPEGSRFAIVQIDYEATAALSFRTADWLLVDTDGVRHSPAEVQAAGPLGEGDLEAGATASGSIAFQVRSDSDVAAIVLRPEGAASDALAFQVP
jgi:hypothetical protein